MDSNIRFFIKLKYSRYTCHYLVCNSLKKSDKRCIPIYLFQTLECQQSTEESKKLHTDAECMRSLNPWNESYLGRVANKLRLKLHNSFKKIIMVDLSLNIFHLIQACDQILLIKYNFLKLQHSQKQLFPDDYMTFKGYINSDFEHRIASTGDMNN